MRTLDLALAARLGRDPGLFLWKFLDRVWVRCPRCGGAARVTGRRQQATLSCAACGYASAKRLGLDAAVTGSDSGFRGQRCKRCGHVLPQLRGASVARHGNELQRQRRCEACGERRTYAMQPSPPDIRDGVDPWFGLPLFLRAQVRGNLLWGANAEHLDHLRAYLGADLRKRSLHPHHMTMMARLPRWMKQASARAAMVAALDGLIAEAARKGLA